MSPANGKLMQLESVQDEVFSQKMMGDGFAIEPIDGNIVSPVTGTVTSIFPTKHAITIETSTGLQVMLHLGIDTVDLNGEPFNVFVKEGEQISAGQKVIEMDLQQITAAKKLNTIVVIVSNMDNVKKMSPIKPSEVSAGITVQTVTSK